MIFEYVVALNLRFSRERIPCVFTRRTTEDFKIKARLDRDGQAGPDQPGYLVDKFWRLKQGAKDLVIKIDRQIPSRGAVGSAPEQTDRRPLDLLLRTARWRSRAGPRCLR